MTELPHVYLIASIAVLAVGPATSHLAGRGLAALDGFVLAAISGLVLLHVMPDSFTLVGWTAILAAMCGLFAPTFVERRVRRLASPAHTAALLLAFSGIAVHAFADGLALVEPTGHAGEDPSALPAAVILHRLPVGLTIWLLLRPLYGISVGIGALLFLSASTFAGYQVGEATVAGFSPPFKGLFQALVAGSLMHVVVHRSPSWRSTAGATSESRVMRLSKAAGAVCGLVLVGSISFHEGSAATPFDLIAFPIISVLLLIHVLGWVPKEFQKAFYDHDHVHSGEGDHDLHH